MKLRIIVLALTCMSSSLAVAQVELTQSLGYVGLKGGYAKPTNLNGRFGYGADVGLTFANGWTSLIYFLSSAGSQDNAQTTVSHYGLGADYALTEWTGLKGLHVGARLGMGTFNVVGTNGHTAPTDANHNEVSVGLDVSYDWMLLSYMSVGGEIEDLWDFGSKSSATLYAFVNARYWF